uniref:Uncharacterized protein n=1 Tax=Heterorhabditis bacteriophora TaxID=37862 RepID=A0A1I7X3B7_HETBA
MLIGSVHNRSLFCRIIAERLSMSRLVSTNVRLLTFLDINTLIFFCFIINELHVATSIEMWDSALLGGNPRNSFNGKYRFLFATIYSLNCQER